MQTVTPMQTVTVAPMDPNQQPNYNMDPNLQQQQQPIYNMDPNQQQQQQYGYYNQQGQDTGIMPNQIPPAEHQQIVYQASTIM